MKIKEMLLVSMAVISLVACSNNSTNAMNDEDRDAMKILEEKREYYEKLDKEKAKVEEEKAKAMETVKSENTEEVVEDNRKMQEDEAKLEAERLKNMTADEKLSYKVDKAKEKIDAMLETAKKARQEELDVEETKAQVEEAIRGITNEVGITEQEKTE